MKGIILAGGVGSRLNPCTRVTNKHLLPVYDKPMIYYPLQTLSKSGIEDILIVSGKDHSGDFLKLLGSGKEFGVNLYFRVQEEAGGIAQALSLGEKFVGDDLVTVILGDNIFEKHIEKYVHEFEKQKKGARIFLKEVSTREARRFGCAIVENDKVIYVEEKPQNPRSNLAMTGLYMFDSQVFDYIRSLKSSDRGELEITDAIKSYVKAEKCYYNLINGFWSDAGTFESLFNASEFIRRKNNK